MTKNIADYDWTQLLEDENFTQENTSVYATKDRTFNAYHDFVVTNVHTGEILNETHFQEGPIKENGVNGIFHEDLIFMILTRLYDFQKSEYACPENAKAIVHLEEAIKCLRARTNNRKKRGVEGTSKI